MQQIKKKSAKARNFWIIISMMKPEKSLRNMLIVSAHVHSGLDVCKFAEGVEKDDVQAIHWYQTTVDLGEIKGCYNLAQAYWWGRLGVEQDKAKAITYYAKAAESGDSNAQFRMG